jgi:hypothetical protein
VAAAAAAGQGLVARSSVAQPAMPSPASVNLTGPPAAAAAATAAATAPAAAGEQSSAIAAGGL